MIQRNIELIVLVKVNLLLVSIINPIIVFEPTLKTLYSVLDLGSCQYNITLNGECVERCTGHFLEKLFS